MKATMIHNKKSKSLLIPVFVLLFVFITSTALGLRLNMFVVSAKNADQSIMIHTQDKLAADSDNTGLIIINVNDDEEKITAPGKVNKYIFNVVNTESFAVKYESTASSSFSNANGLRIPIEVRMTDHDGNYCVGDKDTWIPAEEMDYFSKNTVLAANSYEQYTLEWRWPFESGNDENDTNIGVAAIDHNITLNVLVDVTAEKATPGNDDPGNDDPGNDDPGKDDPGKNKPGKDKKPGGIPITGDRSAIILWLTVASISLVALFVLLVFGSKEKKNDQKATDISAS